MYAEDFEFFILKCSSLDEQLTRTRDLHFQKKKVSAIYAYA